MADVHVHIPMGPAYIEGTDEDHVHLPMSLAWIETNPAPAAGAAPSNLTLLGVGSWIAYLCVGLLLLLRDN